MSWRERLGMSAPATTVRAQNPHNTQKSEQQVDTTSSEYFEVFEYRDEEEEQSRLAELLAAACADLAIKPSDLKDALSEHDLAALRRAEVDSGALVAFARCMIARREMEEGKRPKHYTARAVCQLCGPVWLWCSGKVQGCPWCWNRAADKPIPRPDAVRCADCVHFERFDHPNLGHCAKGQPEALAGLWDITARACDRHLPRPQIANPFPSGLTSP